MAGFWDDNVGGAYVYGTMIKTTSSQITRKDGSNFSNISYLDLGSTQPIDTNYTLYGSTKSIATESGGVYLIISWNDGLGYISNGTPLSPNTSLDRYGVTVSYCFSGAYAVYNLVQANSSEISWPNARGCHVWRLK